MDIPWFQRFLGKMDPFHIKFGLEGNRALEPWKFHGIEFQMSNIERCSESQTQRALIYNLDLIVISVCKLAKSSV
jgi:hypothetical protein